jgi:repressor LexA
MTYGADRRWPRQKSRSESYCEFTENTFQNEGIMISAAGPDSKLRPLTDRQTEVLQFICQTIQQRGYAPTVRELGRQMKIQWPNGVLCHLKALQKKGYIRREAKRARAIQLAEMPNQHPSRPMLRKANADQTPGEMIGGERIDFGFLFGTGHFLLRVDGSSWADHRIANGDFLVLRKGTPRVGNQVVATSNGNNATLQRIIQKEGKSAARPSSMREARILGIVVGIIRRI